MLRVIADAEVAVDQRGHARGGPEVVGPTVVLGALQQQALDLRPLPRGQAGLGAGVGLGAQAGAAAGVTTPAVDGGLMGAQDARDGGRGLALLQQLHRPAATPLQFSSSSDGSSHTRLYRCPA